MKQSRASENLRTHEMERERGRSEEEKGGVVAANVAEKEEGGREGGYAIGAEQHWRSAPDAKPSERQTELLSP